MFSELHVWKLIIGIPERQKTWQDKRGRENVVCPSPPPLQPLTFHSPIPVLENNNLYNKLTGMSKVLHVYAT